MASTMTTDEFERRVKIHNVKSPRNIAAARMVLVDGTSQMDACRKTGVTSGQISPIVRKLLGDSCPCCGHKI